MIFLTEDSLSSVLFSGQAEEQGQGTPETGRQDSGQVKDREQTARRGLHKERRQGYQQQTDGGDR
jgi:hypothetical protein